MSRQIIINRDLINQEPFLMNNPAEGWYVSDEYSPSNIIWQRYEASSSPFVNGERIIAQKKTNDDTIFTIHLKVPEDIVMPVLSEGGFQLLDPITLEPLFTTITRNQMYQEKYLELLQTLSQPRFSFTVEWDGITEVYYAAGAAGIEKVLDPILARAGWYSFIISIPTRPYLTNTGE